MASQNDIIVKIQADISELSKNLNEATDKINNALGEKVNKPAQQTGNIFSALGGKIAGAFSVGAVIALGKQIVGLGSAFEVEMDKVGALSGSTGAELQALTDTARELGATTRYSATEAASGLSYMALAGWDATQMMDGLPGVLNLATAGQLDLARASDIVTDVLTMYGMGAAEAGRMTDVMAYAQANSNTTVEMLGDALKYVGATANAFGMSIEETSAALGVLADNGIKSSMAGRSLKNILARMAAGTGECGKALKAMNIQVTNADGSMKDFNQILAECKTKMSKMTEAQKVQTAKQIAGTEAMSAFLALVESGDGDIQKFTTELNNSAGSADKMAAAMDDNLAGSMKNFKSSMEEVGLMVYDTIQPALRGIVDGATWVGRAFAGLNTTGLEFVKGFGEGVSTATTNALLPFQELNKGIEGSMEQLRMLGGVVTPEFATSMNTQLGNWATQSTAMFDQKYKDDLAILQEYFKNNESITEAERAAMLEKLNTHYAAEKSETQARLDEINKILKTASDQKRELTAEEQTRIKELQQQNYEDMVKMASSSAEEELAVLKAMGTNKQAITAETATQIFNNAKEQHGKILSEAEKSCNEQIKQAYRLKEAGIVSEEEYDKMVTTAQETYSSVKKTAEEELGKTVQTVKGEVAKMGEFFNTETGEILTTWDKLKAGLKAVYTRVVLKQDIVTVYKDRDERTIGKGTPVPKTTAPPRTITPLTTVEPVFRATPGINRAGGSSSTLTNAPKITIGSLVVREEADVNRIAQQLFKLQDRYNRQKGVPGYV